MARHVLEEQFKSNGANRVYDKNPIMSAKSSLGSISSWIDKEILSNDIVSTVLTSEANKLWRGKVLLDRLTRSGEKLHTSNSDKVKPNEDKLVGIQDVFDNDNFNSKSTLDINKVIAIAKKQSKSTKVNRENRERNLRKYSEVSINFSGLDEDITERGREDEGNHKRVSHNIRIYNLNVSPAQHIQLQTVPNQVEFQGDSTWAVIHSMGRNTPMYHFTGAETQLQFNVSWYCNDPANPQEVVTKCRLLEAWSKANGYQASPPVLQIQWGDDVDDNLFANTYWILTSATYILSNWRSNAKIREKGTNKWITPSGYVDPKMYPSTATQELIFRRVSATNLTYEDMVPSEWLKKTKGLEGF